MDPTVEPGIFRPEWVSIEVGSASRISLPCWCRPTESVMPRNRMVMVSARVLLTSIRPLMAVEVEWVY